jgi:meiotic recombination protein SPO11
VDFDPDGLSILSTYKYGSAALAHENSQLAVSSIHWLGIRSTDLQQESADEAQGLLRLSARDRGKAVKMLGNEIFAVETEWRRELQVMLFLNVKAEIQVVSGFGRVGLEGWAEGRILEARS